MASGVVIANAGRWNWDTALNLSALEEVCTCTHVHTHLPQ